MYRFLGLSLAGRLIAGNVARFVCLILLALVGLFFLFDLMAESNQVGNAQYALKTAALFALLQIPAHLYDAMPIAVVAGAIVGLASMANHSEVTVLRAANFSPSRMAHTLFITGLPFVLFTAVMGEWLQPWASQQGEVLRAKALNYRVGSDLKSGIWLRDQAPNGALAYINLPDVQAIGKAPSISVYYFDAQMNLTSRLQGIDGAYQPATQDRAGQWLFQSARQEWFDTETAQRNRVETLSTWVWASALSPSALVGMQKSPERVGIFSLLETVLFQQKNDVDARKSLSILLRRVFHPLALWVMLAMALPFAYVRARGGAVAPRVFAGVLMGVGFHSGNRLFEFMSLVQGWPVWLTAQMPLWIGLAIAWVLFWRFHRLH